MSDCILVLNAGSSSLKFALFKANGVGIEPVSLLRGQISGIGSNPSFNVEGELAKTVEVNIRLSGITDHRASLNALLDLISVRMAESKLIGIGHRVVHGGPHRTAPERVTPTLLEELGTLSPLAPHHQPHNLAAIHVLRERLPDIPQIACFDTAFHARQSDLIRRLPLPAQYAERGVIRYGFHGLSYEYITSVVPAYNNGHLPHRLLIAHLGNGASLCAVKNGESAATTMGFSTLDGLMMGTRSGAIDPGVVLYLMREDKMTESDLTDFFYNRCGLLGVSGISADMKTLLGSNDPRAEQAIALYCHIVVTAMGSMVAALEGLDGVVFTGGVGEHAAPIRAQICERLKWLGVECDPIANGKNLINISGPSAAIPAWVIPTNEELVIARHARRLIASA